MVPLQKDLYKDYVLKHPKEILANVYKVIQSFLKNGRNSPLFHKMLEEALGFVMMFDGVTEPEAV